MATKRELEAKDYLAILRRRWLLIIVLGTVGASIGFGIAHYLPKQFTSKTLVLVEQPTVPGDYVKPVVTADANQRMASMQEEILSRTRLEPVIQQFGLYRTEIGQVSMEELVARLRKAIMVTPIQPMAETRSEGLPGFNVSVTFDDPRLAQQICSTITSMFMEENLKLRQQQAEQTTQFLAKQLDDAKGKLDEQDARLAAFQRQYMGSLPDESETNMNVLSGLSSQLNATTQALARAQQDKTFAESQLGQAVSNWQATRDGQNPETYDQQLSALQAELATLRSKYTDSYPDVIRVENDIKALNKKIAESDGQKKVAGPDKPVKTQIEPPQIQALRGEVRQLEEEIKMRVAQQQDLQQQIKMYQARVQSTPGIEQQYKLLTRDYQTALEFYNDLLKKRDQSAMATDLERRQEGEQFEVLDPANLPDSPSFPNLMNFALGGLVLGLGVGLGIAVMIELQDTSLRNQQDVENLLHLPVLALVPEIKPFSGKKELISLTGHA